MRISQTGIRSGETITSSDSGTQNRGSVIQVRGFYAPCHKNVADLTETDLRDAFNNIQFFAGMDVPQRKEWLRVNGVDKEDIYLEDVPNFFVKFIRISGKYFKDSLSEEQINRLIAGNPNDPEGYWPIREFYEMLPRKPGSKARKHSLVLRPSNWALMPTEEVRTHYEGLYIDLDRLELKNGKIDRILGGYLRVFEVQTIKELTPSLAIVHSRVRTTPLNWTVMQAIVTSVTRQDIAEEMDRFRKVIEWFPPSMHKSLLQKIIRTRCTTVSYDGVKYNADAALATTLAMLALHPGSFVPTIQRFVSGQESFLKRIAVTICEDSLVEDSRYLMLLYAGAAIAQQDRQWQPTDQMLQWCFMAAMLAQKEKRMYKYDWHNMNSPTQGITEWSPLVAAYLLLSEVKSFESDIKMVGSIAANKGQPRELADLTLIDDMELTHCIDHHSFTDIALYMPPPPAAAKGEEVFKSIFTKIWTKKVGVNPRDIRYKDWKPDDPDAMAIRTAQQHVWLAKMYEPQSTLGLEGLGLGERKTYKFSYQLDPSWIAGLIGPIEVKAKLTDPETGKVGTATALVVVRCDDITLLTVIKRPSRDDKGDKKKVDFTEVEKEVVSAQVRAQLALGVQLRNVPETLSMLRGAVVYYVEDKEEFLLKLSSGESKRWEDFCSMNFEFPIYPRSDISVYAALTTTSDGVMEDADAIFDHFMKTSRSVLVRLVSYLEDNKSEIEINKISRDGGAVEYMVLREDVVVNTLLCYVCCIFPAALVRTSQGFKVKNGPLIWSLREKVRRALVAPQRVQTPWQAPPERHRPLWVHQKEILESMIARHESGGKGHEINLQMRFGKTSIILNYIKYLISKGYMPQYCVYTLPPDAVAGIVVELDFWGIPYEMIDMRMRSGHQRILPAVVNLVWHDHMRLNGLDEQMKAIAGEMYFVVDEFHKTMAATKRSSVALEVAKLSWDFTAMSGTVINSDEPLELIRWLRAVVPFEVTEINYFVAIGALLSRRVQQKVVLEEVDVEAPLLDAERYYNLVPVGLGGKAAQINFKEAVAESYRAVTAEVIKQTVAYVGAGEKVFVCVRNSADQVEVRDALLRAGVQTIHLITSTTPINLSAGDGNNIQVVITTMKHIQGYALSDRRVQINMLCFSSQASRSQRDNRILGPAQQSPTARIVTIMSGILSYVNKKYLRAKNLAEAVKAFAKEVDLGDPTLLRALLQ